MWPYAASALTSLRSRLPRMPSYYQHAIAIAGALSDLPGVEVIHKQPHSPLMHGHLSVSAAGLESRAFDIARRDKIWTFPRPFSTVSPTLPRIEFTLRDGNMDFTPAEVRELIRPLASAPASP